MPVVSPRAALAKLVLPRKRERVHGVRCVAHALTCYQSESARPHERVQGKLQAMLQAGAKVQEESEPEGAE